MSQLRDYQIEAVDWLTERDRGLLVAPAGSGKTRMAMTAIKDRGFASERVLWLAHTREQVAQAELAWRDVCFDTAMDFYCYASLNAETIDLSKYTLIVGDEAHHLSKTSWGRKLQRGAEKSLWLLSATPFSDDAEANAFLMKLADQSVFNLKLDLVRDAGGLVSTQVIWCHEQEPDPLLQEGVDMDIEDKIAKMRRFNRRLSHNDALQRATWAVNHDQGIVHNRDRNRLLAQLIDAYEPGNSVLVLVNFVEHLEILVDEFDVAEDAILHGKTAKKKRSAMLQEFVSGERSLLIGTAGLFGEGFDAPNLTHIINAAGGKSPIAITQRAGRASRVAENKSHGTVIDFSDRHLRTLANHAEARSRIYDSLGYRRKLFTT
jgi:superfamily II DNA or RNA helicase